MRRLRASAATISRTWRELPLVNTLVNSGISAGRQRAATR